MKVGSPLNIWSEWMAMTTNGTGHFHTNAARNPSGSTTPHMAAVSQIKPRILLRGLKPVIFIMIFTGLINIFWYRGSADSVPLLEWWIIKIYPEGILNAVLIVLRVVMLIAGILPMTFLKIHTAYICIGMCACICYIYYNDLVQEDVQAELFAKQAKITQMQEYTISGLANLIESRDTETGQHVARTQSYVKQIAEHAREEGVYADIIDDHFISLLYTLAPMHDVGKILVSDTILRKPGKLTPKEYDQMKLHAAMGGKVVRQILSGVSDEEYLKFASDIATYHHEWWNGAGYPSKLKGEEIPLCARIMAIADVYDALISKRCYKEPISKEEAMKIIESEAGTHFDPKLVEVFLKNVPED